jgi:hypothetical protein
MEYTTSAIVWVDDAKPTRKIGSWPFHSTIEATEPTMWIGYDAVTGRGLHQITKANIGYNVRKVRGRDAELNCMTLESAQRFCENN